MTAARVLALVLFLTGGAAAADPGTATEYELKAAFLYNFVRFVEWPVSGPGAPDDSIVVCVLGDDPFGPLLDQTIAGKAVRDRRLVARRIASAADATGCHILFISASEKERLGRILRTLGERSVLTVADSERFAESGGMINFRLDASRIRLEINPEAARRAGLRISSQLLKLADIVGDERRGRK